MEYTHSEIITKQRSKKPDTPCGDVVEIHRDKSSTYHIVCDGLGSGVKANIAATLCASRIKELLNSGFSIRETFSRVVKTMEEAKLNDLSYAVFSIVRVMNDGLANILSYEMPPSIFVSRKYSAVLPQRVYNLDNSIVLESDCYLKVGEGLITFSDGVTNAGIGSGRNYGWKIEEVSDFISNSIKFGKKIEKVPDIVLDQAKVYWQKKVGDDITASMVYCRKGVAINILTGPPLNPENDAKVINNFLSSRGLKIICGATTAKVAARQMGRTLKIDNNFSSSIAPPNYEIEGISLVTEGAVTLNQIYNIWEENPEKFETNSPVTELYHLIKVADKINITVGTASNPAENDISFAQTGIVIRKNIIPLIAEKLRKDGKFVVLKEV